MKKKVFVPVIAIILVLCCAVGGTLAWLTDKTKPVNNTFTVGNINIELKETTKDYKMVPGKTIAKDPKVTVKANSEKCYLFIKVDESANLNQFITYELADGWTKLDGSANVFYRVVETNSADQIFNALSGDKVTVKDTVTKEMMDEVKENNPTLTFTAYAVQYFNGEDAEGKETYFTPAAAWKVAKTEK